MEEYRNKNNDVPDLMILTGIQEIRRFFDRDTVFITSSGNVQAQMIQELEFYEPLTCITAGGFSTIGYSVPAGIGTKLGSIDIGKPDPKVVSLVGDGDFMMTISELSVAVQLGLNNLFFIVLNNYGWIAIKDLQQAGFGEDRGYGTSFESIEGNIYSPDFTKIAEGFGCYAEKILDKSEILPALEETSKAGKPAVLEILVSRTLPYTGSPAWGWWDFPIPDYLEERRKKYEAEIKGERL